MKPESLTSIARTVRFVSATADSVAGNAPKRSRESRVRERTERRSVFLKMTNAFLVAECCACLASAQRDVGGAGSGSAPDGRAEDSSAQDGEGSDGDDGDGAETGAAAGRSDANRNAPAQGQADDDTTDTSSTGDGTGPVPPQHDGTGNRDTAAASA